MNRLALLALLLGACSGGQVEDNRDLTPPAPAEWENRAPGEQPTSLTQTPRPGPRRAGEPKAGAIAEDAARPQRPRASGARRDDQAQEPVILPPYIARTTVDRAVAAGPGWLLSQVELQPARSPDRKFLGFRIATLFGDDPRVRAYGVQVGDILLKAQGQRIVTPGDLITVFQRLRGTPAVTLELLRNGQTVQLSFPIVEAGQTRPVPPPPADAPPNLQVEPVAP